MCALGPPHQNGTRATLSTLGFHLFVEIMCENLLTKIILWIPSLSVDVFIRKRFGHLIRDYQFAEDEIALPEKPTDHRNHRWWDRWHSVWTLSFFCFIATSTLFRYTSVEYPHAGNRKSINGHLHTRNMQLIYYYYYVKDSLPGCSSMLRVELLFVHIWSTSLVIVRQNVCWRHPE